MEWSWSHIVELAGLVVTILALHFSNMRFNQETRDNLTRTMTQMETKVDLMYGWFKKNFLRGRSTESDDKN